MTRHPKIKTLEQICALVGTRPRERKVIHCHGNFDILHPGHIRHLLYARFHGDVLVVSLTCDAHITKGPGRPYVPQDLRALNIALLEIVDYVLIDEQPTPLALIERMQPDVYAKGYDYAGDTIVEQEFVEAYGGSVLFTPGDVVYSSTQLIAAGVADLSIEKLISLLHNHDLGIVDLRRALDRFTGVPVSVVGDTIVDVHVYGAALGHNAKTPTPSILFERETQHVGGAAIVALHLAAAGACVAFHTVLGGDKLHGFVVDALGDRVTFYAAIDRTRPTTEKRVYIADGYRLLKVDRLDSRPVNKVCQESLQRTVRSASDSRAIVFSDFRHGIFNAASIPELIDAIPQGVYRVADSQMASRWGNILDFGHFDLITPNERETRFALGDQDATIRPLGHKLLAASNCRLLMLKMGKDGVMTFTGPQPSDFFVVDSFARDVVDPVGAGDALLAYATLAMVTTANPVIATVLGSLAAAVECASDGNTPVTRDRVIALLDRLETYFNQEPKA